MAGMFSGKFKIPLLIIGVALFFAFYLWSAWQDLHLDPDAVKKAVKEGPAIVVESLSVEKEISGGLWAIHAERTERKSGQIKASQITMEGVSSDGKQWDEKAPSGTFEESSSGGVLYEPKGVTKGQDFTVDWKAPEAIWNSTNAEWTFPKGIYAEHDKGTLAGAFGRITEEGIFYVEKGATLTWKE
ncbi:MAG TPA: hypothetical protein DEP01_05460 [Aminobacterium sp.]|nr:hypothetical protein [Aminobacterium sp.]